MTQGPYRLKILAGDEEWKAGESMYQRGGVRVLETGAHVLRYVVAGTPRQEVIFTQDAPARCNCEVYQRSGACRHVVAATLLAQETGALEELLRRYTPEQLRDLEDSALRREIRSIADGSLSARTQDRDALPKRFFYLYGRMVDQIFRLVRMLAQELCQSEFRPLRFEYPIGEQEGTRPLRLGTASGDEVRVEGKVDRVDCYHGSDRDYIRVIDYKTGNTALGLDDVYFGLRLQLFLYLDAVLALRGAKPAGVFYQKLSEAPMRLAGGRIDEKLAARQRKKLRLTGFILEDPDVIGQMCADPEIMDQVLPVEPRTKGGRALPGEFTERSRSRMLSEEAFGLLRRHTRRKLAELAGDALAGKAAVSPALTQDLDATTLLDQFVLAHPDFSLNGAKAIFSLTGYQGILGYRTQNDIDIAADDPARPAFDANRAAEIEAVKPILQRLKETGWTFGSHTWGHINLSSWSLEKIQRDTVRWQEEVGTLVGPTNILFYPHGARPDGDDWHTTGPVFQYLQNQGFRVFASVGVNSFSYVKKDISAVICDRMHPDGTTLRGGNTGKDVERYMPFYDCREIIDLEVRPNLGVRWPET